MRRREKLWRGNGRFEPWGWGTSQLNTGLAFLNAIANAVLATDGKAFHRSIKIQITTILDPGVSVDEMGWGYGHETEFVLFPLTELVLAASIPQYSPLLLFCYCFFSPSMIF